MRRYEENESNDLKKLFEKLQEMAKNDGKSVKIIGGGNVPEEIQKMIDQINNGTPLKNKPEDLSEEIIDALKTIGIIPSDEDEEEECDCESCRDREACESQNNLSDLLDSLVEAKMSTMSQEEKIRTLVRTTIISAKASGVGANALISSFAKHAAVMNYASERKVSSPQDFEKKIDVQTFESKFDGTPYSGPNRMDSGMKDALITGDAVYQAINARKGLTYADKLAALAVAFSYILNDSEI